MKTLLGVLMTEKCMSERAFYDHDDKELTLSFTTTLRPYQCYD